MKNLILALGLAVALGGCVKMDKAPPKDLPAYVKLYPGSTHMMTMNMAGLTVDASTTPDSPDKVISFYRAQAATDGLTEGQTPTTASSPGQMQAAFTDTATGRMLIVLAKPQQGAGTMVDLSWKTPAKAS
jgi:hypothetical protein